MTATILKIIEHESREANLQAAKQAVRANRKAFLQRHTDLGAEDTAVLRRGAGFVSVNEIFSKFAIGEGHLPEMEKIMAKFQNNKALAHSKAATFGNPQTPVTTAINIKSDYDAKYGAPTEAKPKVFFKYFYVNTATGEKSGEMQLAGKLATD